MNTNGIHAAIYLRVSRDDQTTENQRLVLDRVAGRRGWTKGDGGGFGVRDATGVIAFTRLLSESRYLGGYAVKM